MHRFGKQLDLVLHKLYNDVMNCNLCPRKCAADRKKDFGFCNKSKNMEICKVMLHFGEEPFLTKNCAPSGAIFFAGCNLKCEYCQNFKISRGSGKVVSPKALANLFKQLENAGLKFNKDKK